MPSYWNGKPLPCPFCGGEAILQGYHAPEFWVLCPSIGCKASTEAFGSRDKAIAAWNRRAPNLTAINAELVEVIANLLEYGKPSCPRGMAEWPKAMAALARAKEASHDAD